MSLLTSIINYYETSSNTQLTALRAVLGPRKMFADKIPAGLHRPFVVVGISGATSEPEAKVPGVNHKRIMNVDVTFDVYGKSREQAESTAEAIDDVFTTTQTPLTIARYTHMGTYFAGYTSEFDGEGWFATRTLMFRVVRSAA